MESIIIHADSKKMKALKAFLKAFQISFTVAKQKDSPYDPEFVKMVLEASKGERIPYTEELRKELFGE